MVELMNEIIIRNYYSIGTGKSKGIYEAINNNDCKFVIDYYKSGHNLNIIDERKETLLHKASRNNHYEVFDLLLKLGG